MRTLKREGAAMKTVHYILSAKSAETFKLQTDEALIARIRRARRQLCVGESFRLAA